MLVVRVVVMPAVVPVVVLVMVVHVSDLVLAVDNVEVIVPLIVNVTVVFEAANGMQCA